MVAGRAVARGLSAPEREVVSHPADSVFAALRAGARGYVLKDTDEDEMVRAIRAVGNGEAIFGPGVAR